MVDSILFDQNFSIISRILYEVIIPYNKLNLSSLCLGYSSSPSHSLTRSVRQKPRRQCRSVSPISVIVRTEAAFCLTCPSVRPSVGRPFFAPYRKRKLPPLPCRHVPARSSSYVCSECVKQSQQGERSRERERERSNRAPPSTPPRQCVAHEAASYVLSNERNYRRLHFLRSTHIEKSLTRVL